VQELGMLFQQADVNAAGAAAANGVYDPYSGAPVGGASYM